jgi:hypothetical protein
MTHRPLISIALVVVSCGRQSVTSATVPGPDGGLSPPAFDIAGIWIGDTADSSGTGKASWSLRQAVNSVTGTVEVHGSDGKLNEYSVDGVLSGTTLLLALNRTNRNCAEALTGRGDVSANGMSGTYSGNDCNGPIAGGQWSAARAGVTGTWTGDCVETRNGMQINPEPISLQLVQTGENVSGTFTRTSRVFMENGMTFNTGAISGTFVETTFHFTASYWTNVPVPPGPAGGCQETISGTAELLEFYVSFTSLMIGLSDGTKDNPLGGYTGSNCVQTITGGFATTPQ